jgi:DNA-directed RNA polymerase I subunit RPA49
MDYVAQEEHDGSSESQLVHYTAIFDPEKKELEIWPMRQVVVRSTLRSETQEMRDEEAQLAARKNTMAAKKYALATEFGSRKSRKALEERTMNAIRSDNPNAGPASNAVAANVLRDMAALTGAMPTKEELLAAVDSSKPRPMPNLQAEHPGDVYTSETVVGNDLMMLIDVGDWIEQSNNGLNIEIFSQYAARRIVKLVRNKQIQKLKVLRFMLLCINFNEALYGPGGNKPKKIPQKGRLEAAMGENTPTSWITAIRRKFAQES